MKNVLRRLTILVNFHVSYWKCNAPVIVLCLKTVPSVDVYNDEYLY